MEILQFNRETLEIVDDPRPSVVLGVVGPVDCVPLLDRFQLKGDAHLLDAHGHRGKSKDSLIVVRGDVLIAW